MDLRVESAKTTDNFRSLAPEAPMPWTYGASGDIWDAKGVQVCHTTPRLAAVIVVAVNTCGGFRVVPPQS